MSLILAADVGGTKTVLAIFKEKKKVFEKRYDTKNFRNLESLAKQFLMEAKKNPSAAAFGLPGPIVNESCKLTTIPWTASKKGLCKALAIKKVKLLNDFESICYGIGMLNKESIVPLNSAVQIRNATKAVIGPGTGLGEAITVWTGKSYIALPTEGGHAEFSVRNELEWSFKKFLQSRHGYASYQRVLSGPGLALIYEFLVSSKFAKENKRVKDEMKQGDKATVISKYGLRGKDRLCRKALELFVSFYGREAGNLALKSNALGGVYLAGGITPKILPVLKTKLFLNEFTQRGKLTHLMRKIPVFAIKNEEVGLLGAASIAREL